jgi:hypothetical protein
MSVTMNKKTNCNTVTSPLFLPSMPIPEKKKNWFETGFASGLKPVLLAGREWEVKRHSHGCKVVS